LTLLGNTLLVCDQGQFAVIGVNLVTGRIRRWSDGDHSPRCPVSAAIDQGTGRVYVADTTWRAVLVYENDGSFGRELSPTDTPDRSFRPAAVLVGDGVLYVGNVGENRIDRYDMGAERWLEPWTRQQNGRSRFTPTGLALADSLLAVDSVGASVARVAADGSWLSDIGRLGRSVGEFVRPKSAGVSEDGLIFVVDAGRQSVLVFDQTGGVLTELHEVPGYWHGFTLPAGVVVFRSDRAPLLLARFAKNGWPAPDEFLVVSDSLGGAPLVLFGITRTGSEGGHAG
jgi:DNA-binding beta-propeller fold protein YncE